MELNKDQIIKNIQEYKDLIQRLNGLRNDNDFLESINTSEECEKKIEEYDDEITKLKEYFSQLQQIDENTLEIIKQKKEDYELLCKKSDILFKTFDIFTKIEELQGIIIRSVSEPVVQKRNEDIHSLFEKARNNDELENYINSVCIYMYQVPLLVALITRDPIEIENDFEVLSLPKEISKQIIEIIEEKKIMIENNLILSDKTLIDLIEHVTGENIVNQQRHNERNNTGFNKQYNGQLLINRGETYCLLKNKIRWNIGTTGADIIRFNDIAKDEHFCRRDIDMYARDFPGVPSEELVYRSFKAMPLERKRNVITAILYNLELCYEMFKSYYASDQFEVPVLISLTNGTKMNFSYNFSFGNIPHILGIPPTNKWEKTGKFTGEPELPEATIELLQIHNCSALNVLEAMLEKKDIIIRNCGLNYDSSKRIYYEMFPWEKIILKTNAFIRGDFFKTTSLISGINQNSFLISPHDNISRISITPTRFNSSAINQTQLDPNITFEEAIDVIKRQTSSRDFIFKGMSENNGIWFPKTNASAIGERIQPTNSKRLKTLEKYRYLLEGGIDSNDGGFIATVESPNAFELKKEYSTEEMLNALVEIAFSFGNTAEVERNLKDYLEQIQQFEISSSIKSLR